MQIALLLLIVAVLMLAFAALRYARNKRADESEQDGLHVRRIGDGLKRLRENMEKYRLMTRQLLDETADDALLEAALSNLWAKMAPDLSDAQEVVARLSTERQLVYALYSVTGEIRQQGFAGLRDSADDALAPAALSALEMLQMQQSAQLLRQGLEAYGSEWDDPYLEAFQGEQGKERMVAYIRSHPDGFCDLV